MAAWQLIEIATGHKVNSLVFDDDPIESGWDPGEGFRIEPDDGSPIWRPVPVEVSARQIRRALNALGLRADVEAYVAAQDQDTRDDWEYAATIRRDFPALVIGGAALGLSETQLDDAFRLAETFIV